VARYLCADPQDTVREILLRENEALLD